MARSAQSFDTSAGRSGRALGLLQRLALGAVVALTCACSSFHGLHSARALRAGHFEVGAEVTHTSSPDLLDPLEGSDPRIETRAIDASGRLGFGDGLDGLLRLGTSGFEGGLLRQLSNPKNGWFAVAVLISARPRPVFASTGEAWRLLDFVLTVPVELNPHPRVALIAEPKGMISLDIGCRDAGTGCSYYPFHAGVSAGARLRVWRGLTVGAEGAWYPFPIIHQRFADNRPTSWEASLSVSWLFEPAE